MRVDSIRIQCPACLGIGSTRCHHCEGRGRVPAEAVPPRKEKVKHLYWRIDLANRAGIAMRLSVGDVALLAKMLDTDSGVLPVIKVKRHGT